MNTQDMAEELDRRERMERERRGLPIIVAPRTRHPGEMQADWAVDAMEQARKETSK